MTASSVDPKEVAYYEKLGDMWWDKEGLLWPLHRLNRLRTDYLKQAICSHFSLNAERDAPLTGLNILDIGCGGGILSESMASLGANVFGIDVTENNIEVARRHSHRMALPIRYEHTTAEELAGKGTAYDIVLNMEVVEHVADLPGFLAASAQLVSNDGAMFVSTINRTWKSWLFAIVGAEYVLRWLPKGTHQWHKFVKPDELAHLLGKENMTITGQCGVRVNPLTKGFSLTQNQSVNYMLVASKRQ